MCEMRNGILQCNFGSGDIDDIYIIITMCLCNSFNVYFVFIMFQVFLVRHKWLFLL